MEKGSFYFDDKEVEAIRLELLKKESIRILKELPVEKLDEVYYACLDKINEIVINSGLLAKMTDKLEEECNAVESFIDEYLTPVYLEEHGIDIREEDNEADNLEEEL